MFEITGDHILKLNDSDLRRLVALLCEADLRRAGHSVSAVTAGGDQDAADGGLDVRVELPASADISGFIPRPVTGFQVKVPDMPPGRIRNEMCPRGTLRPVIQELAEASGAYIIVSAQGSVADSVLRQRRQAMRDAVRSLSNPSTLHLDFYDRERLASWVRDHPGMVLWVRERISQPIRGWRPYANWAAPDEGLEAEYLFDEKTRLHDWRSHREGPVPVVEGIQRIRRFLAQPKRIARLVGLSGTGKTRLVQALFDERVGTEALDPALVVYTDLADQPEPSPRDLVRWFIQNRQRAIVVVDNCPPETHRALTTVCAEPNSSLSLITVEYDVGDDDPEGTEVFRLEPASAEVIEHILEYRAPQISQIDRRHIAEFSGGNARVALALAHTVRRGESVATLTDQELFRRLFHQRRAPDDSLMRAAEACSLLYSFNGEALDGNEAELPLLAELAGMSVDQLYRNVAELRSRDLVQRRGPWRAVLPQAIANRLARQALEKTHPARILSVLHGGASERIWKSFSHRIGYLHDCEAAQQIVQGWLLPGGMLSEIALLSSLGMAMFRNVAPVNPSAVLSAIENAATGGNGSNFLSVSNHQRSTWVALLRSIAYDPSLFARSALLIARFMMVEPDDHNDRSAHNSFPSLFHLHLSGTHASIAQRLEVVNALLDSTDAASQDCGLAALDALLQSRFFSGGGFEFGAHPRDYGWHPQTRQEVVDWYQAAMNCAQGLALSTSSLGEKARSILANNFRDLWVNVCIVQELESMVRAIAGQVFWPEGWIAVRTTIRLDGEQMPPEVVDRLWALERVLRPSGLLQQARAYVFSRRWGRLDVADGDPNNQGDDAESDPVRVEEKVERLGREIAVNRQLLDQLLPDLVRNDIGRGSVFGQGLAAGAEHPDEMWQRLVNALAATPENERSVQVLCGFLHGAQARDPQVAATLLDTAITDPVLGVWFPVLQTSVEIGEQGGQRLEEALRVGLAPPQVYWNLSHGHAADSIPPQILRRLILGLASAPDGYEVAVEILSARLHSINDNQGDVDDDLIQCGRELVCQIALVRPNHHLDYDLGTIVDNCFTGVGALEATKIVCRYIKHAFHEYAISARDFRHLIAAIFRVHVVIALDEFLGDLSLDPRQFFVEHPRPDRSDLLQGVPQQTLLVWAQVDPSVRFPRLAAANVPYTTDGNRQELAWTPLALQILDAAPDRVAVLDIYRSHFLPTSWSGSLAGVLESRRLLAQALRSHDDPAVVNWARTQDVELGRLASLERMAERRGDERFE